MSAITLEFTTSCDAAMKSGQPLDTDEKFAALNHLLSILSPWEAKTFGAQCADPQMIADIAEIAAERPKP